MKSLLFQFCGCCARQPSRKDKSGAAKAGNHLAKKVAKKVGKAILKKVPIMGKVLIGADFITLGPKGAFNEAVWPISELWGGGGA